VPVPVPVPVPLPMFGQFLVEPLSALELDPEPDELEELEPELLLLDPLDPVLEVLELDDGGVVEELVAAPATSAPPATSPVVSAPMANTLRSRSFMVVPFVRVLRPPVRAGMHTVRLGSVARRSTAAVQ
jgi:hypothetical protein